MKTPKSRYAETAPMSGVMLTPIDRIDQNGVPWICIQGRHVRALRTTSINTADLLDAVNSSATAVVALIEEGDSAVILGFLSTTVPQIQGPTPIPIATEIHACDQVSIRCGKASITLTRAGKIIVRGTYLSSRSSGVNRIKGGSVQIN